MRRTLAVVACVVILLGLAPAAFAQAPAPKVTITGLFDQITSFGKNVGNYDGNFTRSSDQEWYARTRFRPDFVFEVGRTKAVLGLEFDLMYGTANGGDGAGCSKAGATGCLDINTDADAIAEVKWMYTEFDLTGKDSLLPFIPVLTVARVGGQPLSGIANYKPVYANGDFGGFSSTTTFAPNLRLDLAYVQIEEELATANRLARNSPLRRGEDWAIIISPEITPFKGLDLKPVYSYVYIDGPTSGSTRRIYANQQGGVAPTHEDRHTVGIDMRWRSGPFSLDPTIMYQFGEREQTTGAGNLSADISAFVADVVFGFRLGPLLLEARGVYSTGNEASDDLRTDDYHSFQPLDLDTGYWAGWSAIQALGVDYFNGGGASMAGMSTDIGYDRYGRMGFGVRATYSLTPKLAFYGIVSPTWTAEKVDTDTTSGTGGRGTPSAATNSGDSRYIGTEADIGLTWRFAPNTVFDLQGAYLFAGSALDARESVQPSGTNKRDADDAWTIAARVRMSF